MAEVAEKGRLNSFIHSYQSYDWFGRQLLEFSLEEIKKNDREQDAKDINATRRILNLRFPKGYMEKVKGRC